MLNASQNSVIVLVYFQVSSTYHGAKSVRYGIFLSIISINTGDILIFVVTVREYMYLIAIRARACLLH